MTQQTPSEIIQLIQFINFYLKVGIHDLSYVNQCIKGCLMLFSEQNDNARHPVFTQLIIPLSTFKYKLKNILLYAGVIFCVSGLAVADDEKFTGEDFLKLHGEAKKFWLDGAITAFAQVAAARDKTKGQCIYNWYFAGDTAQKNGLIEASMKKYADFKPSAVLLALTEHACGAYRN